jgi:hypothetical protein
MAKNKRKATSIVARRQDAFHAPIAVPNDHDPNGDGLVVLALKVDPSTKHVTVPCEPCTILSPMSSSLLSDMCPSDPHPASVMVVASGSKSLDEAQVKDCSVDFDDAILEEDRLDFNFSNEEYVDSPKSPILPPAENVSSPLPLEVECLTLPL